MWAHRITGFFIFLATFTMAMVTFNNKGWNLNPGLHAAFGLTIVITMSLLTIGGITSRLFLEKSKWNTMFTLRVKLGHKVLGLLVIFIAQLNLIMGGISYSERGHPLAKTLVIIQFSLFFTLVVIFEILY
jgi:hypothetical protein